MFSTTTSQLNFKLKKTEDGLSSEKKRASKWKTKSQAADEFLNKVLARAQEVESELEYEKKAVVGLETEVAGLKDACYHHTQFKRQDDLLTKFLPGGRAGDGRKFFEDCVFITTYK